MSNPFDYFDVIYCINLDRRTDRWEAVQKEFAKVGILDRVVRFSAIETPENGHIGCMLSHRAIIQKAKDQGWKNVLVFEDDIFFRKGIPYFASLFEELEKIQWDMFYMGGFLSPFRGTKTQNITTNLSKVIKIYCTHAIAYSHHFYDFFLKNIPTNIQSPEMFIKKWKYFDAWLALKIQAEKVAVMDNNLSIFQHRKESDTDGNNSFWFYCMQYFYVFFKYPLLRILLRPFVKIKHALKK